MPGFSRRTALGLSSLAFASCGKSEPYFGRSTPPSKQTLIYEIGAEPSGLDPAHYQVDAGMAEFTFFVRGHRIPRGATLPGGDVEQDAAMWSDGRPVTANDVVCAWRRLVDPALGGGNAGFLYPVANGQEIAEGKSHPEKLGVYTLDEFTVPVILRAPAAHFLKILTNQVLAIVPRHAERARHTGVQGSLDRY